MFVQKTRNIGAVHVNGEYTGFVDGPSVLLLELGKGGMDWHDTGMKYDISI